MASIIRQHTNSLLYYKVLSEDIGIGKKRLWRDYHDTKCRLCFSADESIEYLVVGCTGMNKHGRIRRHDAVVTEISKSLIKRDEIPNVENNLDPHITYSQSKDKEMTINIEIIRDIFSKNSQSTANKPDIVVIDHIKHLVYIIEVCVPFDGNIEFRQAEKLN
ncbi:hypothetical protein DICPUDRAFT_83416 [Dictyostelium purpureum]|uniref:Uncharacterized protein n=1 Tax=Dictyostelium purpureum TaxID=5786 RepID=F0ZZG9_DICPU|nr:uncharacterized protein DICPUDRAFT_83416 [Dictyostelium purpureum]EGC30663.1 hypothetical protein DICPUDRAFT_83416 [Dictyostelium purpureum]|eukprot:XP_003292812.1 hypothetical protein DICPUDRAFT_83416 [Dictyostelium purpureum]